MSTTTPAPDPSTELAEMCEGVRDIYCHLSAALAQVAPGDDEIIVGHMRDACKVAAELLGVRL